MYQRDPSQSFDARLEGRGLYAVGPASGTPSPVEGDSPTDRTGNGPLAPEPHPDGAEAVSDSEDVDELKRMEENAEDGRE
jgi:hypothetical protein